MTLRHRLRRHLNYQQLLDDQQEIIDAQTRLLNRLNDILQRERLEHSHEMRGLVAAWLIHLETPEIEMRDELADLEQVLAHQAARLEEHVL